MQAEQLQRLRGELQAVRDSLEPLQEKQLEELMKDELDVTKNHHLNEAIVPLAAVVLQLLQERLEAQREGKQWGTAPGAWWQAAPLV